MTDSDRAFVKEVVRIIKEAPTLYKYDHRTVILVSHRFHKLACEQVKEDNERAFGRKPLPDDNLIISNCMLAHRTKWLRDYEFEIRPPCEHMKTEKSK